MKMIGSTIKASRHGATSSATTSAAPLGDHFVQFYETEEFLRDAVAKFAAEGFGANQQVILIVTPGRMAELTSRIDGVGRDCADAIRTGRLTFLDARETLAGFMSGSDLDAERCITSLERIVANDDGHAAEALGPRVFGEMVNLLWRDGSADAAIRLEEVWNELARRWRFSLLCACAMGNFYRQAHASGFDQICDCHARVLPAENFARSSEDERTRAVARLQQRARALESEIEHRKTLEKALRNALAERRHVAEQAERANRVKSDFLAVMSHELRTPLNAIFGYEDLLSGTMAGPVTSQQRMYLQRIRNSAQHLLHLIDQVLHLARIEAGREELSIEWLELSAILTESFHLIEPVANSKGLALAVHEPDGPFRVCSDPGKLRQILLNLLSNAVKFTSQGSISVVVQCDNEYVLIAVTDTGIGMSTADLNRVFEPFVQVDPSRTRAYGGTGLGLSVSRHLARMLGGDISVVSSPGQGSTFTLRIPRGASAPPSS